MLIIPLILSVGFDMTLPEFQPYEDASGNYIVSDFDASTGEGSVIEVPSDEIVIFDVSDNEKKSDVSDNDKKIVSEIIEAPASKSRGASSNILATTLSNAWIYTANSNQVVTSANDNVFYIYLPEAGTYTVHFASGYSTNYIWFNSSVPTIGSYLSYYLPYDFIDEFTSITIDSPIYIIGTCPKSVNPDFYAFIPSGSDPDPDVSGGDISGSDYSALISAVVSGNDQIVQALEDLTVTVEINETDSTNKFRALIFVNLIAFLYPIALSIVKNIVGGDSNV